jgi:hypothetical protein
MATRRIMGYTPEEINALAQTDEKLSDVLLVDSQNFNSEQFLISSILLVALRTFQRFERQGVSFGRVTPNFIIDFATRGEAAIADAASSDGT